MRIKLRSISASPIARFKLRATWSDDSHTDFGATGYSDYTLHGDTKRRNSYRARHQNDRITTPNTAGSLSWYLLWGASTNLNRNITSFKKRFKV